MKSRPQPRFLALLLALGATGGCSSTPDRPAGKAALAPCGWLPNCVNSVSGRRLQACGLTLTEAMQRMHVMESDVRMVSGAAAFVAMWRRLPRYRPLAWAVSLPGVFWLAEQAYARFARWRWKGRCDQVCGKL